jgi:hypothetical protein
MEWLEFSDKIRPRWRTYYHERKISLSKIQSAKNKDTGEQAKQIDAVIRMIARTEKGEFREPPLTGDEKDILGIRLDWAYWIAAEMGAKRPGEVGFEPYGSRVSEEEIEDFLINRWQKEGREKYWPLDEQIRERLRSAGLNVKPRDEVKKETGGGETKPPSESGGFRGRNNPPPKNR